jgi:hypothetical protein
MSYFDNLAIYRPPNLAASFRNDNKIETNGTQQIFLYRDINVAASNLVAPVRTLDGDIVEINIGALTSYMRHDPAAYQRFLNGFDVHELWKAAECMFEIDHEPTTEQ